ncbi:hypothetical protein YYC_03308 [Plasmodium yoelii 17X]|uniref:Uncharacterized protein n=1 Tax=Plasmodium yoelii 17X TaxID=1323249 RepID=V7PNP8_PLAYE|nr:hypothetical protein YYC_03308 [Plasmodium yoelii 17X]
MIKTKCLYCIYMLNIYEVCENFGIVIQNYTDKINNSEECDIKNIPGIEEYCSDGKLEGTECKIELDIINAGCLWLFEQNIANRIDNLTNEQVNAFIIYIMIWLNYMLNLKKDEKNNLSDFYEEHIKNNSHYTICTNDDNDCNSTLKNNLGYENFKDVIFKNMDFSNIDFEDISKFYEAFKLLCKIHTEYNENNLECTKYLEYANKIVDKFKELNGNSSVTRNTSYSQVWSTLSTDYDNLKNKYNGTNCMNIPSLPSIKRTQNHIQSSGVTSSSLSIVNKLIIALSIFGAIAFFLGISYKRKDKKYKEENESIIYDSKRVTNS